MPDSQGDAASFWTGIARKRLARLAADADTTRSSCCIFKFDRWSAVRSGSPQQQGAACYREASPVEAIEQENGVPVDNSLRPVNSSHGAFESAPVHALGLRNVIADPAIVAELSGVGRRHAIWRDHTAFHAVIDRPVDRLSDKRRCRPRRANAAARRAGLCGGRRTTIAGRRKVERGLSANVVFALALLAAPMVRRGPMEAYIAICLARLRPRNQWRRSSCRYQRSASQRAGGPSTRL